MPPFKSIDALMNNQQYVQAVKHFILFDILPYGADEDLQRLFDFEEYSELEEKYPKRVQIFKSALKALKARKKLSEEQKNEIDLWMRILNGVDQYVNEQKEAEDPELTPSQIEVFEEIRNFFENGGTEGYLKLPTGFGKTVLASKLIDQTQLKTLILVPTRLLADQTEVAVGEFASDYLDVDAIYGTRRVGNKDVTIMTYSLFTKIMENPEAYPDFDISAFEMMILDEAHSALSDRRTQAVLNS